MDGGSSSAPPLTHPPAPAPAHVIAHRSSQTGDTLHVAGLLALYPDVGVLVIHIGDIGTAEELLKFYRQVTDSRYPLAAISPDSATTNPRVKIVYVENETVADGLYKALSWVKASDKSVAEDFQTKVQNSGKLWYETPRVGVTPAALVQIHEHKDFQAQYFSAHPEYMGNLGVATLVIADKFRNPRTAESQKVLYTYLAKKLTARTLPSADVFRGTPQTPTFGGKALPDASAGNKAPIVLLWSRYTGTNTAMGHNPDGDSCVQGQKQINDCLTSLGRGINVVTIGHGPRGTEPFKAQFDVGEFYKQPPIGGDRATQQSFFLALMEKYPGRVYQIGQKTGGMDGAALLGIPTIYLEPNESSSIERMKKWSDAYDKPPPVKDNPEDKSKPADKKNPLPKTTPPLDSHPPFKSALPFYRGVIVDQPAPAIIRVLRKRVPYWNAAKKPLERARSRLVAMIFAYPLEMGLEQFRKELEPRGSHSENMTEEQVNAWKAKELRKLDESRFDEVVKWVKALPDADVQEHLTTPALDGVWTRKLQSVSQQDLGKDSLGKETAGYSVADLDKIAEEMTRLIDNYTSEKAAVIRQGGAYRTRFEAQL